MSAIRRERSHAADPPLLFESAEQIIDSLDATRNYDTAKWNLLGHADPDERFAGHHPWLKRRDHYGNERVYSVPVLSAYSPENQSILVVRKDPWTPVSDPESWLVAEQNVHTNAYVEPKILSVNVDAWRQLWIQIAPSNYHQMPTLSRQTPQTPRYEQIRIQGQLDQLYHMQTAEYNEGLYGNRTQYEDIVALESMIVALQQIKDLSYDREFADKHHRDVLRAVGARGVLASL
ncbi:hypothetical protein EOL96_04170 [Candidatus Saccharibacteria bacterium]|nr:hypothetical protein [Candidatus Saccharibacteria bacterium]